MFKRLFGYGLLASSLGFVALVALFSLNVQTYRGLTAETDVAEIAVDASDGVGFRVALLEPDGKRREFELLGEEWQLDARMIKWRPWFNILGNTPLYRLERISGRYRDILQARHGPQSVYALSANPGLDLWSLVRDRGQWLPGVDAAYGTAVYLPLAIGARYRVSMSMSGLIARPISGEGRKAIGNWQ